MPTASWWHQREQRGQYELVMAGNGDDEHGADSGRSGQHDRDLHQWDRELGGYGYRPGDRPDPRSPSPPPSRRAKRVYFIMMGTCLGLCAIAWAVVSRYSTLAAVIMSVVALVLPPLAAIIANSSSATDRRQLPLGGHRHRQWLGCTGARHHLPD